MNELYRQTMSHVAPESVSYFDLVTSQNTTFMYSQNIDTTFYIAY